MSDKSSESIRRDWVELEDFCHNVLNLLATVEALASYKTKADAAEALGLTRAGINQRLERLETFLGVEPGEIVSVGHGSNLTALGDDLLALWRKIDKLREPFLKGAEGIKSKRKFRVAILQSIWDAEKDWMEAEYKSLMPESALSVIPIVNGSVYTLLEDRQVDAAIGYPPLVLASSFVEHPWRSEPMKLVISKECAKDLPKSLAHLSRGGHASPADIRTVCPRTKNRKFYTMRKGARMRDLVRAYLSDQMIDLSEDSFEERNSVSEALQRISQNQGISILPDGSLKELKYAEVIPLLEPLSRPVAILYPKHSLKKGEQKAFHDSVIRHDNPYSVKPGGRSRMSKKSRLKS